MAAAFVHLRVHTEYSLSDGIVRMPALLARTQQLGMAALAVSDRMNLFGLVKFYQEALAAGVKPLIASDMYLYEEGEIYLFSAYALNLNGYKNIRELLSKAYRENLIGGSAYIKREWLANYSEGVLLLSGAKYGDIGQSLLLGKVEQAKRYLQQWMQLFPGRFYVELQRTARAGDERYLHMAVDLALAMQCPVVATNEVCFLSATEFEAHETRVCIHERRVLNDPRRERKYSEQQYLKSAEEMQALFADIPEAIENTQEIAKRCSAQLELGKHHLPEYAIPHEMSLETFFRDVCAQGLRKRLAQDIRLQAGETPREESSYWQRLDFEIDVILQMGFPGYFLIVMDFIRWAREQDIPVGPGRGSGAGSLVAYALQITDLDPLQYDLLFERFLNPERISMPDFDVDFCQERRDEVIQYVVDTYGKQAVSQIITFGTMAAKGVVRDVTRVQGKPYGLGDKLSKLIPTTLDMTLAVAYDSEQDIQTFLKEDADAQSIWDMALQLEGLVRNTGKHAAGVVIAPNKLEDFTPVYRIEGEDILISQFDKDDVEYVGLVKFDFLGLKNLTVIQWALKVVNARLQAANQPLQNITQIPLDDPKVFQLLQRAQTTAVFQLESSGMKDLILRLKPSNFEDIVALVALYRPGPLESGMVDDFISRKHGKQELAYPHPKFQHPCLQPILKPTYGIILYQEQVMQIAQEMGGYSLGAADVLRRAMGKKKTEEMAMQREQFIAGSVAKGFSATLASNIFDLMEKFAGYGFNKSHSAAYALVAYQTAWLKAHYPSAFMAAVMSADLQNTEKIVTFIEECRIMQLTVLPPDINQGYYLFTIDDDNRIIYGLGAIKGLGSGPVSCLIEEREKNGPFKNLFDLCARTDSRKLNKRALEALILSGSMDSLGEVRSLLMYSLPEAMRAAEQKNKNLNVGIGDLFGEIVSSSTNDDVYQSFRHHESWSVQQQLTAEKEILGLYLSGHPIDAYRQELDFLRNTRLSELKKSSDRRILALIINVRIIRTKRGALLAVVQLDDRSGRVEMALFSEMYERYRELLVPDALIVVEGDIEEDAYTEGMKINPKHIYSVEQARIQKLKALRLNVSEQELSKAFFADELKKMIMPFCYAATTSVTRYEHMQQQERAVNELPVVDDQSQRANRDVWREQTNTFSGCQLLLVCQLENLQADIVLAQQWRIKPSNEALNALRKRYGAARVELVY